MRHPSIRIRASDRENASRICWRTKIGKMPTDFMDNCFFDGRDSTRLLVFDGRKRRRERGHCRAGKVHATRRGGIAPRRCFSSGLMSDPIR